jgi:hypothetical protein
MKKVMMGGHLASIKETRNAYKILIERPEGKRPLRKSRRRWWALVNTVLKYRVP